MTFGSRRTNKYIIIGLLAASLFANVYLVFFSRPPAGDDEDFLLSTSTDPAQLMCDAAPEPRAKTEENSTDVRLAVMPEVYTENMTCLSFSKHVDSADDFYSWRAIVVQKYRELRNIPSPEMLVTTNPPNRTGTFEINEGDYLIQRYSMQAIDGDTIIFYEVKPANVSGSLPTVLVVPGSGNQGVADVLGLDGEFKSRYYQKSIAIEIAKRGYIVFAIENRGWGERTLDAKQCGRNEETTCSGLIFYEHATSLGYDYLGLQTADTLQLLQYMRSIEYVDKQRIAIAGLSLGAFIAMSASVLDSNITSTVLASGVISIEHTWSRGTGTLGTLRYFDGPDLASTISPRHLYLSYGSKETLGFGIEADTLYSADKISQTYELLDAGENIKVIVHSGGHTYDIPSVLEFLDTTLKDIKNT